MKNGFLFFKGIFRKPTHTDCRPIISQTSRHPTSHKLAYFHSMLNRLVTLPITQEEYSKELNIIKQIAINNNFDVNLVKRLLNKKIRKKI